MRDDGVEGVAPRVIEVQVRLRNLHQRALEGMGRLPDEPVGFSMEKLCHILTALGRDVYVKVSPRAARHHQARLLVIS